MRERTFDKQALTLLQGRVACKLAEINQMVAPGITEPFTQDELQARADRHMDSLAPMDQEKLRLRAIVAYAELERLTEDMTRQLDLLSEEITRMTRTKRANSAYRNTPMAIGFAAASL
jgi:hypothetical protein